MLWGATVDVKYLHDGLQDFSQIKAEQNKQTSSYESKLVTEVGTEQNVLRSRSMSAFAQLVIVIWQETSSHITVIPNCLNVVPNTCSILVEFFHTSYIRITRFTTSSKNNGMLLLIKSKDM